MAKPRVRKPARPSTAEAARDLSPAQQARARDLSAFKRAPKDSPLYRPTEEEIAELRAAQDEAFLHDIATQGWSMEIIPVPFPTQVAAETLQRRYLFLTVGLTLKGVPEAAMIGYRDGPAFPLMRSYAMQAPDKPLLSPTEMWLSPFLNASYETDMRLFPTLTRLFRFPRVVYVTHKSEAPNRRESLAEMAGVVGTARR